ncbi:MAG: monovalent cation:proton antiporter-2 (CPA2) family protein [Myxococcota bacterium]
MHGEGFFFQAFVYLSAAVVAVPIAKRLGLGSVLGYLLAGMVIGPFGMGLIGAEGQDVMHFAEFGVVMMLFVIGLELEPSMLWRMRGPILGTGGLQVVLTAVVAGGIGVATGLPWQTALAIGLTLALSSTAMVLQSLAERDLMSTDAGQRSFAVLLFQDIAVIPMLAFFPLLAVGTVAAGPAGDGAGAHAESAAAHGQPWIETLPGWAQTLVVLGAVAGVIVAGRVLVRPVFRIIAKTELRELFTAAALLLVIGIALLMTSVGLSAALGTFLAGVVLADSEYRHELESDIDPFKGLLLAVFFIAVGASVDFELIGDKPALIAGLVVGLVALKFVVLAVLARVFTMGTDQGLLFSLALAQGGEFAFVLFSYASQHAIIPVDVASPLVAVVAVSMAATPLLLVLWERVLRPRIGTREAPERESDVVHEDNAVILAGFGRVGSIVGRFLRSQGVQPTVLESDSDHVDLLRRLGLKVYYGDAARHDLCAVAGAAKAKLLIVAVDDHEKAMAIVRMARKHFPHLRILARAGQRTDVYDLAEAGMPMDDVYRETLDTSLRMGVDALRHMGFRGHQATRAARAFRAHDEAALRQLHDLRGDHKAYITAARELIVALESTMQSDLAGTTVPKDMGWDSESLRAEYRTKVVAGE